MTMRATKTTGFDPDVYNRVVEKCDKENISWSDAVNRLIRAGNDAEQKQEVST